MPILIQTCQSSVVASIFVRPKNKTVVVVVIQKLLQTWHFVVNSIQEKLAGFY